MTGIIEMKILAEFVGVDGVLAWREVFVIRRNADQPYLKDFGLTVDEGLSNHARPAKHNHLKTGQREPHPGH